MPAPTANTPTELPEEAQRQLDQANSQLAMFARDLKRLYDAERERAHELAEAHAGLADAHARLQVLDHLKSDFLNFISHELSTPLSGLQGVHMLDPGGDPQRQAELIDILRHGYERLASFVESALAYFRRLAGTEDILAIPLDVAEVAHIVAQRFRPAAIVDIEESDAPVMVLAAPDDLDLVLGTLLGNAVKFGGEAPRVAVTVRAVDDQAVIEVGDQGQGFPPARAEDLFRPFTVADIAHHTRGTGLSLPLARAILEDYDGTIEAHSAGEDQGSTFTVRWPLCET